MAGLDGLKGFFSLNGSMILCFNNIVIAFDSHSLHKKSSNAATGHRQKPRGRGAISVFLPYQTLVWWYKIQHYYKIL